jgi:hypothetical protein
LWSGVGSPLPAHSKDDPFRQVRLPGFAFRFKMQLLQSETLTGVDVDPHLPFTIVAPSCSPGFMRACGIEEVVQYAVG